LCISFEPPEIIPDSDYKPFLFAWNGVGGRPQDNWESYMELTRLNIEMGLLNGEVYVVGNDFEGMGIVFGPGEDFAFGYVCVCSRESTGLADLNVHAVALVHELTNHRRCCRDSARNCLKSQMIGGKQR
jgi:hypothetical protein